MRIIAFTGRKKQGKSTLADLIIKKLADTHNCAHVNFADALKRQVAVACGVELADIELHKDTFRTILQWWGTEFRRRYQKDDTYWIARWLKTLTYKIDDTIVLCSDCRFNNEAEAIRFAGGLVIDVCDVASKVEPDSHASEQGVDSKYIDMFVRNDSSKGLTVLDAIAESIIIKYKL